MGADKGAGYKPSKPKKPEVKKPTQKKQVVDPKTQIKPRELPSPKELLSKVISQPKQVLPEAKNANNKPRDIVTPIKNAFTQTKPSQNTGFTEAKNAYNKPTTGSQLLGNLGVTGQKPVNYMPQGNNKNTATNMDYTAGVGKENIFAKRGGKEYNFQATPQASKMRDMIGGTAGRIAQNTIFNNPLINAPIHGFAGALGASKQGKGMGAGAMSSLADYGKKFLTKDGAGYFSEAEAVMKARGKKTTDKMDKWDMGLGLGLGLMSPSYNDVTNAGKVAGKVTGKMDDVSRGLAQRIGKEWQPSTNMGIVGKNNPYGLSGKAGDVLESSTHADDIADLASTYGKEFDELGMKKTGKTSKPTKKQIMADAKANKLAEKEVGADSKLRADSDYAKQIRKESKYQPTPEEMASQRASQQSQQAKKAEIEAQLNGSLPEDTISPAQAQNLAVKRVAREQKKLKNLQPADRRNVIDAMIREDIGGFAPERKISKLIDGLVAKFDEVAPAVAKADVLPAVAKADDVLPAVAKADEVIPAVKKRGRPKGATKAKATPQDMMNSVVKQAEVPPTPLKQMSMEEMLQQGAKKVGAEDDAGALMSRYNRPAQDLNIPYDAENAMGRYARQNTIQPSGMAGMADDVAGNAFKQADNMPIKGQMSMDEMLQQGARQADVPPAYRAQDVMGQGTNQLDPYASMYAKNADINNPQNSIDMLGQSRRVDTSPQGGNMDNYYSKTGGAPVEAPNPYANAYGKQAPAPAPAPALRSADEIAGEAFGANPAGANIKKPSHLIRNTVIGGGALYGGSQLMGAYNRANPMAPDEDTTQSPDEDTTQSPELAPLSNSGSVGGQGGGQGSRGAYQDPNAGYLDPNAGYQDPNYGGESSPYSQQEYDNYMQNQDMYQKMIDEAMGAPQGMDEIMNMMGMPSGQTLGQDQGMAEIMKMLGIDPNMPTGQLGELLDQQANPALPDNFMNYEQYSQGFEQAGSAMDSGQMDLQGAMQFMQSQMQPQFDQSVKAIQANYDVRLNALKEDLASRGLLNSGIYDQAVLMLNEELSSALVALNAEHSASVMQIGMQYWGDNADRQMQLRQMYMQEKQVATENYYKQMQMQMQIGQINTENMQRAKEQQSAVGLALLQSQLEMRATLLKYGLEGKNMMQEQYLKGLNKGITNTYDSTKNTNTNVNMNYN